MCDSTAEPKPRGEEAEEMAAGGPGDGIDDVLTDEPADGGAGPLDDVGEFIRRLWG